VLRGETSSLTCVQDMDKSLISTAVWQLCLLVSPQPGRLRGFRSYYGNDRIKLLHSTRNIITSEQTFMHMHVHYAPFFRFISASTKILNNKRDRSPLRLTAAATPHIRSRGQHSSSLQVEDWTNSPEPGYPDDPDYGISWFSSVLPDKYRKNISNYTTVVSFHKGKVVPVLNYVMQAYGGVFLASAQAGGE
jgi:hypothetical protein